MPQEERAQHLEKSVDRVHVANLTRGRNRASVGSLGYLRGLSASPRSSTRRIFPLTVFGSSFTNSIARGYL